MGNITNGIPEKTIERLSEYRRTLLASHKQGITHIFSHVLAGIHGITPGADRLHKPHPRQPLADEHRRAGYGASGTGHHEIFQRQRAQAEDHGRLRRRSAEGGHDHRRNPVLPHGAVRADRRRAEVGTDANIRSSSSRRPPRWLPSWSCRSSTPASRGC